MSSPPGNGIVIAELGFIARKKRSCATRRPCSELKRVLSVYGFFPPSTSAQSGSGHGQEDSHLGKPAADGFGGEKRLKKLKLKVGGVTHTIHTKPVAEYDVVGGSYVSKHAEKQPVRLLFQDSNFGKDKPSSGKISNENVYVNEHEPTRKSKRVPKRRKLDLGLDEGDDYVDEEIRYLGRINATRVSADGEDYKVGAGAMPLELSDIGRGGAQECVLGGNNESLLDKTNGRLQRSEKSLEAGDYMKEEAVSDDETKYEMKRLGFGDGNNDRDHVTVDRAVSLVKDVSLRSGSSLIEFPDGLPDASSKTKGKVSNMDQQLKKAEAAQKRKVQAEKLAKEAEAEAIRRILGQDSGRKKKEDKIKKQRDDVAQEKAIKGNAIGANTVRWVIGPAGTTVTFSDDIGLPRIFNSTPCSYPPPREKCAGPNCTNSYKYRDSKLKLPLCSLHCYKAIQGELQPLHTS
ncbi:hypothetical protein LINPERPRIM_LOCUS17775 [Linum perenne]